MLETDFRAVPSMGIISFKNLSLSYLYAHIIGPTVEDACQQSEWFVCSCKTSSMVISGSLGLGSAKNALVHSAGNLTPSFPSYTSLPLIKLAGDSSLPGSSARGRYSVLEYRHLPGSDRLQWSSAGIICQLLGAQNQHDR